MHNNTNEKNQDYFEKQSKFSMQCGLHSINNLLQKQAFSKNGMEEICEQLSSKMINPHKHILGGDYDANVIMLALQKEGCECKWIDRRNQFKVPEEQQKKTVGFMVNTMEAKQFYHKVFGFSARHWSSIRACSDNQFVWYDSKQKTVVTYKSIAEVQRLIKEMMKRQAEIIWVYK